MGPIAGLAAGLGIAALLSHFGMGAGFTNFLTEDRLAGDGGPLRLQVAVPSQRSERATDAVRRRGRPWRFRRRRRLSSLAVPADVTPGLRSLRTLMFDGFLRVAKLTTRRLQAADDAKNLDDIREFVSPELYAEIKLQMDERGNQPQRTRCAGDLAPSDW